MSLPPPPAVAWSATHGPAHRLVPTLYHRCPAVRRPHAALDATHAPSRRRSQMDRERVPRVTTTYGLPPVTGRKRRLGGHSRLRDAQRREADPAVQGLKHSHSYANLSHPFTPEERALNHFQGELLHFCRTAPFVPYRKIPCLHVPLIPGDAAAGAVFIDPAPLPASGQLFPIALEGCNSIAVLWLTGDPGEAEAAAVAGNSKTESILGCLLFPCYPSDAQQQ